MKAVPLLFSAPMIHALLDGRKTQTRRLTFKVHHANIDALPQAGKAA